MSADTDIEQALRVQLSTAVQFPVVLENDSNGIATTFYQAQFYPAETDNTHVRYEDTQEYSGFYQVNVYTPIDSGRADYYTAINEIKGLFARGLKLTQNSSTIEILKVTTVASIQLDEWSVTPVSIYYHGAN